MRASLMRTAALALVLLAGPAIAAEPQPLSFTAEGDTYTVPEGGLSRVEAVEKKGLEFCPIPAVETALGEFTAGHTGDTVTVAIGETEVFHLQIVTPYEGGCITWPLHPRVAETYRAMLTGEATAQ